MTATGDALARALCTTCIVLAASSCWTLSHAAREKFAKSISCPPDQVEVQTRPDVAPHSIAERSGALASPAPDVAADPARLGYWKKQRADIDRRLDDYYTVYEARGCGKQLLLCCGTDPDGFTVCNPDCTNIW